MAKRPSKTIRLGQVVWVEDVIDPQGKNAGEHAVIILITEEEYAAGQPLAGVVVSSQLNLATPSERVDMRWHRSGHPATGFNTKCAAMCKWIVQVDERKIKSYGGRVYGAELAKVLACIQANQPQSSQS